MKGILIIVLAASGWSSNSTYRSEYEDMPACIAALGSLRVDQPKGGDRTAVTAIAFCTPDPKGLDAQRTYFHDVPADKRTP